MAAPSRFTRVPTSFSGRTPEVLQDLLDLFVGRVKIHIQRLGGQPNPNRILTPTAVISVRGTIFDVSIDDDDETTIVAVEEGSVEVRHALKPGAAKIVNAGESLHVYRDRAAGAEHDRQERAVSPHRARLGRRRLSYSHQPSGAWRRRYSGSWSPDRRPWASAAAQPGSSSVGAPSGLRWLPASDLLAWRS